MRMRNIALASGIVGAAAIIVSFWFRAEAERPMLFEVASWDPAYIRQLGLGSKYLSTDFAFDVPAPERSDAAETKREIEYLRELERGRTEAQKKAIYEENGDFTAFFFRAAGIDAGEKPLTLALTRRVAEEIDFFIYREKWRFQRPRPYQVDPTLTTVIPPPGHSSYPSGHAGRSRAVALLMAALDPEHEDIYASYADSVGKNREIAGFHFPSDTKAGVALADRVVAELFKSEDFLAEVDAVRFHEWEPKPSLRSPIVPE